jgi:hypothetical protein
VGNVGDGAEVAASTAGGAEEAVVLRVQDFRRATFSAADKAAIITGRHHPGNRDSQVSISRYCGVHMVGGTLESNRVVDPTMTPAPLIALAAFLSPPGSRGSRVTCPSARTNPRVPVGVSTEPTIRPARMPVATLALVVPKGKPLMTPPEYRKARLFFTPTTTPTELMA